MQYISKSNFEHIWSKIKDIFATKEEVSKKADATLLDGKVDVVEGKGLSANDYTNEDKAKLGTVAENAQVNILEGVKVNGAAVEVDADKNVDIAVPTKVSELTNDISYLVAADIEGKVDKVDGKGLSTNDLTDDLKTAYDKAVLDVKNLTATGGQANVIESIKVNGTAVEVDENKNVDIKVPTKVSELTNDISYLVADDIAGKVDAEEGKGLSTNDYSDADKAKLAAIEEAAQVNVLETVKVNGVALTAADKAVDVVVPTKVSDLENDSEYVTTSGLATTIAATGHVKFEFVETLPETGVANVIYFSKDADAEDGNEYAEYVWNADKFEKVGAKKVDFSGLWSKTELVAATNDEIDAIINA